MILLLIFAFVAGAATAVSPCALPVLPVVFAAGTTGGRRRPLGIATGLAVSFAVAVVALVYLIAAFGLPDGLLRTFAIAVLLVFGLSLMVPKASAWVEFQISKLTSPGATKLANSHDGAGEPAAHSDGFWSGVLVGGGLGFVYAPCAGPILAGVITATASQTFSSGRLAVALAYGIGSAATFYVLMLGGRKLVAPLARRSGQLQFGMGLVMVLVALAMFANLDTRFQTAIASDLPSFLVNPTGKLERSGAVSKQLARTSGRKASGIGSRQTGAPATSQSLPALGTAPEFTGNEKWFNTPGGKPVTLASLRGKVVLVDFWIYTCINCIRTLPYVENWYRKYAKDGFVVVGVHTPEFPFEHSASNVQAAINQQGLTYPIAQDNEYKTWDAYGNQYWPAKYLIDANGTVRLTHFGEGEYPQTEAAIRTLLAAKGAHNLGNARSNVKAVLPSPGQLTQESYLGAARAQEFMNKNVTPGVHDYGTATGPLPLNALRYGGIWMISSEAARASANATLQLHFRARRVYLVLGTDKGTLPMQVMLDGKPIANSFAGADVRNGVAQIRAQRLYTLVNLPKVENHTLTLRPADGISGYAFTFG